MNGPYPYWQEFGYDTAGNRTTETQHGLGGNTDQPRTYTYPAPGQPHAAQTVVGPADGLGLQRRRPPGKGHRLQRQGHLIPI